MIKRIKEILNIQLKHRLEHALKSLKAFTLAEMLVVIGIIGVVSALTIPNLQQGTNSQEVVTKVTKARATFSEAMGRSIATYGEPCTWSLNQSSAASQASVWYTRFLKNVKLEKDCGLVGNTNTVCWNGDNLNANWYKAKLVDGTSIAMNVATSTVSRGYGCETAGTAFSIVFDIDGPNKGTGAYCDDLYTMSFNANGEFIPTGASGNLTQSSACATWVLENKNADFLKATYTNGAYKCKNGTILNWSSNTRCN